MIFAFFVLLLSYANYPEEVLVYIDSVGEPLTYLSKEIIFYISSFRHDGAFYSFKLIQII